MPESVTVVNPVIDKSQLHAYTARAIVSITCTVCHRSCVRTVDAIRRNVRANGDYICQSCANHKPEYLQKQHAAHPTSELKPDVVVNCAGCDTQFTVCHRSRRARQHTIYCSSCTVAIAHRNGKYRHVYSDGFIAQLREHGTQFWKNLPQGAWKAQYLASRLQDPLYRQMLSESGTKAWDDPAYRARMDRLVRTTEFRNSVSRGLRRRYQSDPELRQRIATAVRLTMQTSASRLRRAAARARQPRISRLQEMLYAYLDDLRVGYHREGPATSIGYWSFDCLIPHISKSTCRATQLLIECQGDYWHTLPKQVQYDKSKFTYITRYFPEYEIMYIWEHEFYVKDRVLDRLKLKLGIGLTSVAVDVYDLWMGDVTTAAAREFLEQYHYIGKGRGGELHGLYHADLLVGVVQFSKLVRQNVGHQFPPDTVELSRLCLHPAYHQHNLCSWWVSRLLRNKRSVISYCDTTVGHTGATYKACNFKLHHTVPADYWYVDRDGYVMHKKTLYNRASKMGQTEADFAVAHGYCKKYGGPKLCFHYAR